jgi:hypothetical protein
MFNFSLIKKKGNTHTTFILKLKYHLRKKQKLLRFVYNPVDFRGVKNKKLQIKLLSGTNETNIYIDLSN